MLPYVRFEVPRELLRIRHFDYLTLKMEALFTSETSVSVYQSRWRNSLEDLNFPAFIVFHVLTSVGVSVTSYEHQYHLAVNI
jgi:hypothetical protein